jgi:hypothetical protein
MEVTKRELTSLLDRVTQELRSLGSSPDLEEDIGQVRKKLEAVELASDSRAAVSPKKRGRPKSTVVTTVISSKSRDNAPKAIKDNVLPPLTEENIEELSGRTLAEIRDMAKDAIKGVDILVLDGTKTRGLEGTFHSWSGTIAYIIDHDGNKMAVSTGRRVKILDQN